jgi:hypothetical protein
MIPSHPVLYFQNPIIQISFLALDYILMVFIITFPSFLAIDFYYLNLLIFCDPDFDVQEVNLELFINFVHLCFFLMIILSLQDYILFKLNFKKSKFVYK